MSEQIPTIQEEDFLRLKKDRPLYVITLENTSSKQKCFLSNSLYGACLALSREDAERFIENQKNAFPQNFSLDYTEVSGVRSIHDLKGFFHSNVSQLFLIGYGIISRDSLLHKDPDSVQQLTEIFSQCLDNYNIYLVFEQNRSIHTENGCQVMYLTLEEAQKAAAAVGGTYVGEEIVAFVFKNCINDLADFSIDGHYLSGWEIKEAARCYFRDTMLTSDEIEDLIRDSDFLSFWVASDNSGAILLNYNNPLLFTCDEKLEAFDKSGMTHPCERFDIVNPDILNDMPGEYVFLDGEYHCTKQSFIEVVQSLYQ